MQHVRMVHFLVHIDSVTDLAIFVRTNGKRVPLVLHRLQDIPVFTVCIDSGIEGMRASMTCRTEQAAAFISPVPVKILFSLSPLVKSGIGFRFLKFYMTIQAIRFVHTWFSGNDIIC